jgi:hypothetical protein
VKSLALSIFLMLSAGLLTGAFIAYPRHLPHRDEWMLDPQGRGENPGAEDCKPPRIPIYIDLSDGTTTLYLECLQGTP